MARVSYRSREDLPENFRWLFDNLAKSTGTVGNVFRALAHSPQTLRGVMVMGTAVLHRSALNPRLRELAIIRVGQINAADYERTHHIEIGKQNGVTDADLQNLSNWEASGHFNEQERAVFRYVEEITRQARLNPGTVEALTTYYDEAGVVEIIAAVSFYNMMCRVLNSLDIDVEDDFKKYVDQYR